MFALKKHHFAIVFVLLGWLFVQLASVEHEFSAEHLLSVNHKCLSQVYGNDDTLIEFNQFELTVLQFEYQHLEQNLQRNLKKENCFAISPRGPPTH
ncbi:hypothetical protein [Aliikangiella maris]|uniref:Uncharacterized protein n=2 Tax=Aliikangiella maris TaxID=3162458 RepID=A0ABV3MJM5_9GAMM